MDANDPRRALEALAGEYGLPILRFLRDRRWTLASRVADGLGIHTSTASKYLAAFHEAGFLDRKVHAAKRPTHAYRLHSPLIRIEFDLANPVARPAVAEVATAFVARLVDAVGRMGGTRMSHDLATDLFGSTDWPAALNRRLAASPDPRAALDALVHDARQACANRVGASASGQLVRVALANAAEGRRDVVEGLGLAEVAT